MIRPAKTFLFDILENNLRHITGDIAVDAASANFKNKDLFKTKLYCGIDFDQTALEHGLRDSDKNSYGILANMANLEAISSNSADVVVSTNTLYHLPYTARQKALLHLCRITAPHNGYFICELPLNNEFEDLLNKIKQNFKSVKIVYFKNPFSRAYEWIFTRDGFLGSHPIAGLMPFRLVSWLISRLEYLTCRFPPLNKHALILAKEKNTNELKRSFEINGLPITSARLHNILPDNYKTAETLSKKILIIITKGEVGGAQVSVLNLGRALKKLDYDVTVGFGNGNFLADKLTEAQIPWVRFKNLLRSFNPFKNIAFAFELRRYLQRSNFDIVYFNSSNTLVGAWATKSIFPKPQTVFTYRGLSLLDPVYTKSAIKRWFFYFIFKILLRGIDTQVFVSNSNQFIGRKLGLAKNDQVIYNGLDSAELLFDDANIARKKLSDLIKQPLENKLIIGSIGRLSYQKNFEFFIRNFPTLKNNHPSLIGVIIGDGPEKERLSNLIKELKLEKDVFLVGEIKDGYKYLPAFDIFSLPSRYEGMSVTLIEALFAANCIITTDVGGNREVVDDAGILYPLNDDIAYIDAISKLLADDSLRQKLSSAAFNRSKLFNITNTAKAYDKLFTHI